MLGDIFKASSLKKVYIIVIMLNLKRLGFLKFTIKPTGTSLWATK